MNNNPILLIEDNKDDEILTLRALRKSNIVNEVVIARDGAKALDLLFNDESDSENKPLRPSVILLDLKLPKVDGLEVLEKIRNNESTMLMPVVILTSSKEEEDIVRGYTMGANSYIRKPVDFDQFIDAVKNIGMYWLLLNETIYPG